MPILLAGTTEFVHIEQVSALFKFRLGQVLLYKHKTAPLLPHNILQGMSPD
jgi:putative copper export protein